MIPSPVYDDDTGDYIPQEWERFVSGETRVVDGKRVTTEDGYEIEMADPNEFDSAIAGPISKISAWMDKGVLPFPGAMLDQPARLLRAVETWRAALDSSTERIEQRRGGSNGQ
jgi:hypothetical protein